MHLKLMGARSIKLFGYFKKMTEEAHRQPRAVPRLRHCVYLESYSCGEGKEQQSSNRATESLFLVPFAVGSFETPSPLARNKEQQREETNGTGSEESEGTTVPGKKKTGKKKTDGAQKIMISKFHLSLCGAYWWRGLESGGLMLS